MGASARALVFSGYGINCEEETAAAFHLAGARADIVHLGQFLRSEVTLLDYQIVAIPGGFSFGDDLGAGRVLATTLKHHKGAALYNELREFGRRGGLVLGICNGFQVLVTLGLLPGLKEEQQAGLLPNGSGHFEDRWCRCRLENGEAFELPVRHNEGRLVFGDPEIVQEVRARGLVFLEYCDQDGQPTDAYPANPNGTIGGIAGLINPAGNVIGMMPHPEAYLSPYNHPNWPAQKRRGQLPKEGGGLQLFRKLVARSNAWSQSDALLSV